jgi:hypothetical protein
LKKPSFLKVRLHFCFEPGEKHWHGATATTIMTHIAIQEWLDGKPVDWIEQVSDEQYEGKS